MVEPEGDSETTTEKRDGADVVATPEETADKKPKLKKKEMQAILDMDMKFKKVSFEHALTAQEKAERKKKKGKKKEADGEATAGEKPRTEDENTKEAAEEKRRKKERKRDQEHPTGEEGKAKKAKNKIEQDQATKKNKVKKGEKKETGDDQEQPTGAERKAKKSKEKIEEDKVKKSDDQEEEGKVKKGKKKAAKVEQDRPSELGPQNEAKPKGRKGKKTSEVEIVDEEGCESRQEVSEEDQVKIERDDKQKKKKKKGESIVTISESVASQAPSEGDALTEPDKPRKKKKPDKQVRLQVEETKSSSLIRERSSKKSIASSISQSMSGSFGLFMSSEIILSSSSSDEEPQAKATRKRKKSITQDKKEKKAEIPTAREVTDEAVVKKKEKKEEQGFVLQGPKKKLSKKQRAMMAQEQAEKARIQAELEAQRLIEEEKKRVQEEKKMAREKDKREIAEQVLRNEQLTFSTGLIKAMLEQDWKISEEEKKNSEWGQYLKCDGLPDPINPPQMNTYLHLWKEVINDVTVEEVGRRTREVLKLLEVLQDHVDDPFDVSEALVEDWKWIRGLCRDHLKETLNMATYRLLRDIDSRLNRIDIPTADFNITDSDFNLCLYVLVQLPTPMYNPRNISKKKLEIDFSDIKMKVVYPLSIDTKFMATRAMYLKFDHLSDTCDTYDPITLPAQYQISLLEATSQEWYKQLMYKYEHRIRPEKKTVEDEFGNLVEIEPPPEPELIEGELPSTVPFQILDPPAPQYVVELEDEIYARNREGDRLEMYVGENVVNLRKHMIIGGVYFLELFYQPPQPRDMVSFEVRLTTLKLPKRLEEVPVYIKYVPPAPEDPLVQKTPEELEQDVKKQEEILDSLIFITVTLPEHVMFLDLPIVCQWDDERKVWSTQNVIDLKHVEEQNYITFRTGLFGPFALAVNRYLNFPFQMWEIKPETDGTVTFQLTCAILMVEFNVKSNTICMTQLQNSPNNALQDVIGIYFKLPKLMRILREGGVDIFPAYDAFKYVEGVCEKQWPMEKHTYYSMGLLSCAFNFSYSRWNNQAGRRRVVMQMREYHPEKPKQKTHSMLLVSPLNAVYIDCTEVSPAFNETPTQNMKFCSDLFHLMKATCSITTRNKVLNGPQDVAKALADILIATRIFSFS